MTFDPKPWFIGLEGVKHSAEVARTLAWASTNGASGIIQPKDLRVRALSVPGGGVRIDPGGFVIESKYAGAALQSYIGRAPTETTLDIPATGSSGGATRYVVARINDPDYPGGGNVPTDPDNATYALPMLVSSLSSSRTEIPLAKIVQPANTGTITQSMITDLREIANPREKSVIVPRPNVTGDAGMVLKSTSAYPDGEWFPNVGGQANNGRYDIPVPTWATRMQIRCEWLGIGSTNNPGAGGYWVSFGPDGGTNDPKYYTQKFGWNSTSGNYRENWIMEQEVKVRSEWRGTDLPFFPRANFSTKNSGGGLALTPTSGMVFSVRFLEVPEI